MRFRNTNVVSVILILLIAAVSLGTGSEAPERVRPAEPASHPLVFRTPDTAPDPDRVELSAQLRQARQAGEAALARDLYEQLALLDGAPLDYISSGQQSADDIVVVRTEREGGADKWQGNDILVAGTAYWEIHPDIVVDTAGILYAAVEIEGAYSPETMSAYIYRSTDGGYGDTQIGIFRVNLDNPAINDFTTIETNFVGVANPRVATDSAEYDTAWYAYLVYNSSGVDAWVLRYSLSTDYGASWQTPTSIHTYCGYPDEYYDGAMGEPDLDFGNGSLHVAFDNYPSPCTVSQLDVFVITSENYGNTWTSLTALASSTDDEFDPAVAAAKSSTPETVVVAYTFDEGYNINDVDYAYSTNGGGAWSLGWFLSAYNDWDECDVDLAVSNAAGRFHSVFTGGGGIIYYGSTPYDAPESFGWTSTDISYHGTNTGAWYPDIAVNPTLPTDQEASIVWSDVRNFETSEWDVYFDGPTLSGFGTIVIDSDPDDTGAIWHIYRWNVIDLYGTGDMTLTDMEDGDYTVGWAESEDWTPLCTTPVTLNLVEDQTLVFACTYDFIAPLLTSVADVGNDQGRQLRLSWERSAYDAPGFDAVITGYEIYRRQDADKLAGWDWLDWLPAHGDDVYQYVAPSLCDSTADGGICWTTYMIRAATDIPFTYYDSAPDSGYSVDNLAPNAPEGFAAAYGAGVALSWEPSADEDFRFFKIYRGDTPDFTVDPEAPLHTTIDIAWLDGVGGFDSFYKISAVDFAGNESEAVRPASTTGANAAPPAFRLLGAHPNPFNPRTVISFDLPAASRVDLRVYDVSGCVVRRLVDGARLPFGRQEVTWEGVDAEGRPVPAGVYFYALEAGGYRATGRVALIK